MRFLVFSSHLLLLRSIYSPCSLMGEIFLLFLISRKRRIQLSCLILFCLSSLFCNAVCGLPSTVDWLKGNIGRKVHWHGEYTGVLAVRPVPMPVCLPQIPQITLVRLRGEKPAVNRLNSCTSCRVITLLKQLVVASHRRNNVWKDMMSLGHICLYVSVS